MPPITIITVNLNNAVGLIETINSIKSQGFRDFEYIIVDGGSNDRSLEIILKNKKLVNIFKSEPDDGIYDAMNKGVELSSGDWLIFMNSGDMFAADNVLEEMINRTNNEQAQIVYGNTIVKEHMHQIRPPNAINKKYLLHDTLCHQSIFIKRDVFTKIGIFDISYKIIADREFLLRAVINNIQFEYYDFNICIWEAAGFSRSNVKLASAEVTRLNKNYLSQFQIMVYKCMKITQKVIKKCTVKYLTKVSITSI